MPDRVDGVEHQTRTNRHKQPSSVVPAKIRLCSNQQSKRGSLSFHGLTVLPQSGSPMAFSCPFRNVWPERPLLIVSEDLPPSLVDSSLNTTSSYSGQNSQCGIVFADFYLLHIHAPVTASYGALWLCWMSTGRKNGLM